ncbi:MAG: PASTA domain-containing protein [Candidatus Eremiobacteraeota bacterium]|nr:PASTA domain-containing protein [Candidatus Eremiobacteraeota bacterium]
MLKPVLKKNEETGEKQLFMVPESDLEERFVLWFAFHHSVPRLRLNRRDALVFHALNDPDTVQYNLTMAFEEFKKRYNYVEIPYLVGVSLSRAREELRMRGLQWAIEREVATSEYPPDHVISQNPLKEAVAAAQSVVYLTISKNP